jgi:hypothetical protein
MVGAEQGQIRIEQMPQMQAKSVSFMNPENACESESEFPYHAISLIHG